MWVGDSSSTPVKYYNLFFNLPDSEHLMMSCLFIGEYDNLNISYIYIFEHACQLVFLSGVVFNSTFIELMKIKKNCRQETVFFHHFK